MSAQPPTPDADPDAERRRRRAALLRELAEARALLDRVAPRRARRRRERELTRRRRFRG